MSTVDLGMSLDYCHNWGVKEAVREIFQNAIDAEIVNPDNKMSWSYDDDTLRISNRHGKIGMNTLLLGVSSKRNDDKTIGQYGEGYKVAIVVLKRLGKDVKIYNRVNREIWEARTVKSRRFGEDVVVMDIKKQLFADNDADLVFEISGISESEFEEIKDSNLLMNDLSDDAYLQSDVGRVLVDEDYSGRVYVGGLYVTTSRSLHYGYDFEPSVLKLERDRSLVDGFDLQFACGKAIVGTQNIDFINEAVNTWDGSYIHFYVSSRSFSGEVYNAQYLKFVKEHGKDAIPVTSTDEFNRLSRLGFNPVLVRDVSATLITRSPMYETQEVPECEDWTVLAEKLEKWFGLYIQKGSEAYDAGLPIIRSVCEELRNG